MPNACCSRGRILTNRSIIIENVAMAKVASVWIFIVSKRRGFSPSLSGRALNRMQ